MCSESMLRALNTVLYRSDRQRLDGNFLELLDVRQTSWGCNKTWFHTGLQRKSNGQAPAGSILGRFKATQTMNRISVYLHSQFSVSSQNPQGKGNLTHKKLFTTGVLEASPCKATGRECFDKELHRTSGWILTLWAHCHKWQSQGMSLMEEFTVKSRK